MAASLPRSLHSLAFAAIAILGTAASFGVATVPAYAAPGAADHCPLRRVPNHPPDTLCPDAPPN